MAQTSAFSGIRCWRRYVAAGGDVDTADLMRRSLPPGNVKQLHDLYVVEGGKGRYGTFRACWQRKWAALLKFSTPSNHGVCSDCFRLKNTIADAKTPAAKFTAVGDYRAHVGAVAADRDLKDSFWESPPFHTDKPVLILATDGMDQAKWRIPRSRDLKETKDFQKFHRPRSWLCKVSTSGFPTTQIAYLLHRFCSWRSLYSEGGGLSPLRA